jgi:iron(III) transport system ATP-binding protein
MLVVQGLFTEYPNERGEIVKAAQDVSFTVAEGQLFTLLGPSGCGKTTTLRSIAGLERPRAGEISVNGRVVYSSTSRVFVAPNRRGFGMVFQSYAIWPHMTVFENAAFPLEVRGPGPGAGGRLSRSEIRNRVMRVLGAVQMSHLADREATKLSGGQQQRLALARALVMEPALLLLDEPLSNLDAKLREKMRFELKRLQRELKITTVYVTHDQSEALALSRQIAVMHEGRILQIGTPREVYERPASQFVADFVGNTNFIEGVVMRCTARGADPEGPPDEPDRLAPRSSEPDALAPDAEPTHSYVVRTEIGDVNVISTHHLRLDERVAISVRPEDVELTEARPGGDNVWEGRVDQKVFLGEAVDFQVKVGARTLLSRRHPTLRTKVADAIFVQLNPEKCVVFRVA